MDPFVKKGPICNQFEPTGRICNNYLYQQQIMTNIKEVKSLKSLNIRKTTKLSCHLIYLHGFHVTVKLNFTPSSVARRVQG